MRCASYASGALFALVLAACSDSGSSNAGTGGSSGQGGGTGGTAGGGAGGGSTGGGGPTGGPLCDTIQVADLVGATGQTPTVLSPPLDNGYIVRVEGQRVYFLDGDEGVGGKVAYVPIDGGSITLLSDRHVSTEPTDIEFVGDRVYWSTAAETNPGVLRVPDVGGAEDDLTGPEAVGGIATDGTTVFYAGESGSAQTIDAQTGDRAPLATDGFNDLEDVFFNDGWLYLAGTSAFDVGHVGRVNVGTGVTESLADQIAPAARIVADAQRVIWVGFEGRNRQQGGVWMISDECAGSPVQLVDGIQGRTWLALDGDTLFVSNVNGIVGSLNLNTGAVRVLLEDTEIVRGISVSSTYVYIARDDAIVRVER